MRATQRGELHPATHSDIWLPAPLVQTQIYWDGTKHFHAIWNRLQFSCPAADEQPGTRFVAETESKCHE